MNHNSFGTIKCPYKYKYELVKWYDRYFKQTNGHSKKKTQLYAIWYKSQRTPIR